MKTSVLTQTPRQCYEQMNPRTESKKFMFSKWRQDVTHPTWLLGVWQLTYSNRFTSNDAN
jgi:hypothetical protein